ncbi:aromatic ring-hydroxylating dioxygenase subunit alpha [Paraburkholderia fungorum]
MSYLMNCWYVAAWDSELSSSKPLARTLLDERVVLFRDASGKPVALADRCPHRFAPLSMGTVCSGAVQCAYHGLRFDHEGKCVHNPHGDGSIPKAAVVRSFPVVEQDSLIWIWMGEPIEADPSNIPAFPFQNPEEWYVGKRYLYARANYLLETDNIMDLSHIQYLHPTTLGSGSVNEGQTTVEQDGNTVWSKRFVGGEFLPDFLYDAISMPRGTSADRWLDVRWDPPGVMWLQADIGVAGRPREESVKTPGAHLFTPETESTTHYWFSMCFPKALGDLAAQLGEANVEGVKHPFEFEDLPMLEAQQKSMRGSEFWSLKPVLLPGDAAAVRARRVMDKLIKAQCELTQQT